MKSTLRVLSEPTSVNDENPGLPSGLLLKQNVPNPFDHSTTITYILPESNYVSLKIYNLNGQEIAALVEQYQRKGEYRIEWEPEGLPGGLYYCRLQGKTFSKAIKLLLQK
jgi:hypothetical protein